MTNRQAPGKYRLKGSRLRRDASTVPPKESLATEDLAEIAHDLLTGYRQSRQHFVDTDRPL